MNKKLAGWIALLLAGVMMLGIFGLRKYAEDHRQLGDLRLAAQTNAAEGTQAAAPGPATQPARAAVASKPSAPKPTAAPAAAAPAAKVSTTQPAAAAPTSTPAKAKKNQWHLWRQDPTERLARGIYATGAIAAGALDPAKGYLYRVQFDQMGAGIYTLKLSKIFTTVADKQAWEACKGDHAAYMAKVRASRASKGPLKGHYSLLNPVGRFLPYATQAVRLAVNGVPDPNGLLSIGRVPWKYEGTFPLAKPAEGVQVRFSITLQRDMNHFKPGAKHHYVPALKITKTYTVLKKDYSLKMSLKVENLSSVPLEAYVDQLGPVGVPREEHYRGGDDRFLMVAKQKANSEKIEVAFLMHQEVQGQKVVVGTPTELGRSDDASPVLWLGESNKFFASMVYLQPKEGDSLAASGWDADFYYTPQPETPTSNVHIPAVRVGSRQVKKDPFTSAPEMSLPVGSPGREMTFDIFAGPKDWEMFSKASAAYYKPLYTKLHYIDSIHYRSCCLCGFNSLTLGMMWLLDAITKITFGNYGIAIMVLVVLVRLVLHPLTKKSQISMMNMQKLGPEMERIKKKYADDKEAMQKEMMKFYKTQGSAPLLGCLPMFLQMPIWISLWGALTIAVELRHAAFLPFWITDLAAPDVIFSWSHPITIPYLVGMIGPIRSFNLLPLLVTVAMFFQTKLNPQMGASTTAPTKDQQTQQRMMKIMMPLFMLLIFYNAASGLNLYIATSTFAGVIEQIVIKRHIEAKQAAEAAATTTVKVPGKAPRDNRPKKPKGPQYFKRG